MMPISSIGRKLVMAATGQFMILYAIAHLLGIFTFYTGGINAYAEGLRRWPLSILLWLSRIFFISAVVIHMFFGIRLFIENNASRPVEYIVKRRQSATFAGRTMIWTGLAIFGFVIFHLANFTFHAIGTSIFDADGGNVFRQTDVFGMMRDAFKDPGTTAFYAASMTFLLIHLSHGIQSSLQTLGLSSGNLSSLFMHGGTISAVILSIGYASIPIYVLADGLLP